MGTAYIVVEHHKDGVRVSEHASKKAAHEHGMALRRKGVQAFAHSKENAAKYGLDPRATSAWAKEKSGGGGGDQPRDDHGRFESK